MGAQMLKDEPISILLTMIILFGQDFCVLQQKKHVQKQQETYIVLLQKYISSQLPARKACAKFAACMEVVTNLREMVDIKKIRNVSINVRIWEMFWNVYFVFLYVIWTSIFFFFFLALVLWKDLISLSKVQMLDFSGKIRVMYLLSWMFKRPFKI